MERSGEVPLLAWLASSGDVVGERWMLERGGLSSELPVMICDTSFWLPRLARAGATPIALVGSGKGLPTAPWRPSWRCCQILPDPCQAPEPTRFYSLNPDMLHKREPMMFNSIRWFHRPLILRHYARLILVRESDGQEGWTGCLYRQSGGKACCSRAGKAWRCGCMSSLPFTLPTLATLAGPRDGW